MSTNQISYMQRCFELARMGEFMARPNPMVGCVVVAGNEVVGEGWHARYGDAHAEINALDEAGDKSRGSDLYVSLEPCSHWGQTSPCVDRIIERGVGRVIFGMYDPNPLVSGGGIEKLLEAGIKVEGPFLENEAAALNPGFIRRMKKQMPWVRLKMAMSLDGRTAMASGESKWITGEEARADVQRWRARSDAIITGIETVLADDPQLTARLDQQQVIQPLRVVVDSRLRVSPSARIFQGEGTVLVATAVTNEELIDDKRKQFDAQVPEILSVADQDGRVDLAALLSFLAKKSSCNDVLIESGATLGGAMLKAGLVDELVTYIAPKLLGSDARPLFALSGLESIADHVSLEVTDVELLGKDCRMRSRVIK